MHFLHVSSAAGWAEDEDGDEVGMCGVVPSQSPEAIFVIREIHKN